MTWAFAYLACFMVGLVVAAVTGLISDLRAFARHTAAVPHPDMHLPALGLVARRLSPGLILGGALGFVLTVQRGEDRGTTLVWAVAVGLAGVIAGCVLLRRRACGEVASGGRATVVRDIQPGGYGQVRLERDGVAVLLAAQSADTVAIPAGSEVEVVECTRSVITVRMPSRP